MLNGGSSSGKTALTRALQEVLDGYWLRLGVDTLIDAAPPRLLRTGEGLVLAADGTVSAGPDYAELERAWMNGVAATAAAGARVLIEDNFLGGPTMQERWRQVLADLVVGWVGVRCAADVAAERELSRGDRIAGMATHQATSVHEGVQYDLEVDTTDTEPDRAAQTIRDHFFGPS